LAMDASIGACRDGRDGPPRLDSISTATLATGNARGSDASHLVWLATPAEGNRSSTFLPMVI
jgi:hypothetical protein